ncbi:AAA family ATPase [uncultured Bacteroides sp.]|uniref:ATP-dependent nuclease n=1 Tax=uncultured Bacteroides sp. TaxID=162156 RepID=UPI002AABCAB5|nr:AAA family ATPase [uncultured Bacteroides sp.]
MKIKRIKIGEYKNIENLNIDCSKHNGITVLIGNNGSGKSNFIEAISNIFYSKYTLSKSLVKDYEIEYINSSKEQINILASNTTKLPQRVVAIYSGEEDRMWQNIYSILYKKYIDEIVAGNAIEYPKMLYLNKFYWHISLLCLLVSDADDVKKFINENIGIQTVDSIEFIKDNPDFKNSTVKAFVDKIKNKYTDLKLLKADISDESDLFAKFYIAFTNANKKLIKDIIIKFNDGRVIEDLSEGQKKQILIKAALEFAGQEDSLFLLDEPDAHIHVSNKKIIFNIIEPYKINRHIILTTHSPTLCKYADKDSLVLLEDGKYNPIDDQFEAAKLLVDDNDVFKLLFSVKHIIITEGKTDVQYISKALRFFETDYSELQDIEFLVLGGTDGDIAKELLLKIRNIDTRKVILLVDRDDAGLKCSKKILEKKDFNKSDLDYRRISTTRNDYLLMLPSINANQKDFLIEDYFKQEKMAELTKNEIDTKFDNSKNFKEFPPVKDNLKNTLLPNFCKNDATADDMVEFKILLDKLKQIIAL